jgi:hypothetical protein
MESLFIQGTEDTPEVNFNRENNKYIISGRSLPEDVNAFYQPVMDWLDQYEENPFDMEFEINLEYFNTASSKVLLDIFMKLDEIKMDNDDASIVIKWFYDEDDEDMFEAGEEYKELIEELQFDLMPY